MSSLKSNIWQKSNQMKVTQNKQFQLFATASVFTFGQYLWTQKRILCDAKKEKAKNYFDKKLEWQFRNSNVVLISGNSNPDLADKVAQFLGIQVTPFKIGRFFDGEIDISQADPNLVRGKHVYIIQSTHKPVNENLSEVALLSAWLKRQSAQTVTIIFPYYGYNRNKKGRIFGPDVAKILETMPIDRILTLDIHAGQTLGYFGPRIKFENLEATIVPLNYFLNLYGEDQKREDYVIISPDADSVWRAKMFCELFNEKGGANCSMGMALKHPGRNNEEAIEVIGDVQGKNVIIINDLIDTASNLCSTVKALKEHGAKKVYAYATHTLFTGDAFKRIVDSQVDKIITTDTIPAQPEELNNSKIIRLSIAPLLGEALRRVQHNISLENMSGITFHLSHKNYHLHSSSSQEENEPSISK